MHIFLSAYGDEEILAEELRRSWPESVARIAAPGRVIVETAGAALEGLPPLAFARQLLPEAAEIEKASIATWARSTVDRLIGVLPNDQPWRLHVSADYGPGDPQAGLRRCELIRREIEKQLKERRRRLLRGLTYGEEPFTSADSLVQVLPTSPDSGWISVAPAPMPHTLRRMIWPFPKGEIPLAVDKQAPSRAFEKLIEAETRWGTRIAANEKCVDLGAAPGSWSYVALNRDARVIAVDRATLRSDLMNHPRLQFIRGDAFAFGPEHPVDWLLCDVIAAPQRSIELLLDWLRQRRARAFVVTIKFKGRDDYARLDQLKAELPRLASEWFLLRLCANKNEVCAFGRAE